MNVKFIFTNTKGYEAYLAFPGSEWFKMEDFTAIWDSRKLDVEYIEAAENYSLNFGKEKFKSLYKFKTPYTYKDRVEHIISYKYKLPYINFMKDYESKGYYLEYILKTGSLWTGSTSILSVKITFSKNLLCSNILHLDESHKGQCISEGLWILEKENIKLNKNIRLLFKSKKLK